MTCPNLCQMGILFLTGILLLSSVKAQWLKLSVHPPFEFVNEDWTVGRALPELSICTTYSGPNPLTLTLSSGNDLGYFKLQSINDSCWTLILQNALDADQQNSDGSRGQTFSLALLCSDGKVLAYGNLDIQVVDINDNPPMFIDTESTVSVPESTASGTEIFSLTTTDPDTGVGGINDFRLADSFNGAFEVKRTGCEDMVCRAGLFLKKKLIYDEKNLYTLEVIASDGAGRIERVNEKKFKLAVNVEDVQNKPPRFTTEKRIQYVREDTNTNENVFLMQAIDGDSGVSSPNRIFYSISENPYFGINTTTGWVFLKNALNREKPEILEMNGAINLQIEAEEGTLTQPRPSTRITITIVVTDVDDEAPSCDKPTYVATVPENSQPLIPLTFTSAVQLYVFDKDEGSNGEFSVSLTGSDAKYFDVSPKIVYQEANLLIRVKDPAGLDYENKKELSDLTVLLTPNSVTGNQPDGKCNVRVRILDENDNAPKFNQSEYFGTVSENREPGAFVTNVAAFDHDTSIFQFIQYSLTGAGAENFAIDQKGNVVTEEKLDREEIDFFNLVVIATDDQGKGNRETVPLKITVSDENDNEPIFSKKIYSTYLPENSLTFTQVPDGLFIKASDADEPNTRNSNLSYWIIANSYGAENFSLNPFTGLLLPNSPGVDRESMEKDFFNLSVIAQDQGKDIQFTATATILIYINDTNDNSPTFDKETYSASTYENATFGDFIVKVSARDADRSVFNSRIAYRIVDIQDKFTVDSESGIIRVAKGASLDIDASGKKKYDLTVLAMDQGFPQRSGETQIEILVEDINDKKPAFGKKIYEISVKENAPPFSSVLNLTATDPDSDPKLIYRISQFMDALTEDGRSVSKESYDYSKLFGIRAETGELYTSGKLDRERLQHLALLVQVEDINGSENLPQQDQAVVDVVIEDANDNSPVFSRKFYSKRIQENTENGSIIMSLTATDSDSNSTVAYSLSADARRLVKIGRNSGELTVVGEIDFERIQWINFTVTATDLGSPPRTSTVPVALRIMDQNDNSPVFHPSSSLSVRVSEATPIGSVVAQVNASDRDSGSYGVINYFLLTELTGGSPSFVINQTDGKISVNKALDREARRSHTLTVKAVDDYTGHLNPDSHEATAIVEVEVLDVNDNPPVFTSSTTKRIVLTENNKAGFEVTTISASDMDDPESGNGRIRYFLIGGNATLPAPGADVTIPMFSLEPQSGELSLNGDLRGRFGSYFIEIEAVDLGEPALKSNISIAVEIQDHNDHKPLILKPQPQENYEVPENWFNDSMVVLQIEAVDSDQGNNADIRYSIKKTATNHDWKLFTCDLVTGKVYLKGEMDFEKQSKYSLTAMACDSGAPPLCDEAEFTVSIADQDDNCPFFERTQNYTHEVAAMENQPAGSVVSEIASATDVDTLEKNTVTCYEIITLSPSNAPLRLESRKSRKIIATKKLDREKRDRYSLLIRATDCEGNTRCGSTNFRDNQPNAYDSSDKTMLLVRIIVADLNDNAPRFTQRIFEGGIQYDTKIGSRVTRIRARDEDLVDQGILRYYMAGNVISKLSKGSIGTSRTPFFLNSTTGDITTNIIFQPAWKGSFEFAVNVNDSSGLSDTAFVRISLLSYDQQVELLFEASPNKIWDQAFEIIQLLSTVTNSNATIDDVRPSEKADGDSAKEESKVLVHFLGTDQAIIPVEEALRALDNPSSSGQSRSKQELISVYGLKYAGHNLESSESEAADYTVYFAFAGVVGGLLLVLTVLISVWCCQTHRYRRKLKAATTLAFGSADLAIPTYNVPGTNLHSNSNPVWSGKYGMDNYGVEYDDTMSQKSKNSLDENDIRIDAHGESTDGSNTNSDKPLTKTRRAPLPPRTEDRSYNLTSNGKSSQDSRHNHYSSANTERAASPPSRYPAKILASLESTEL